MAEQEPFSSAPDVGQAFQDRANERSFQYYSASPEVRAACDAIGAEMEAEIMATRADNERTRPARVAAAFQAIAREQSTAPKLTPRGIVTHRSDEDMARQADINVRGKEATAEAAIKARHMEQHDRVLGITPQHEAAKMQAVKAEHAPDQKKPPAPQWMQRRAAAMQRIISRDFAAEAAHDQDRSADRSEGR